MAAARRLMVDGQLRPNQVNDPFLIAAMLDLPRHRFLPARLAPWAHADADVPLPGGGRVMLQPMMIGKLITLLALRQGDRLLVVGAGAGYGAAVAARMGARVTALEEDAALIALGRQVLPGLLPPDALRLVEGPLAQGHAEAAPYDAILVEGEVPAIPKTLSDQLAEGGRLATVLAAGVRGPGARAVLGRRAGGSFAVVDAFDCLTAPLPAFQTAPGFVF
jgi:protein-L-isoaspartate(D-aspartate) O-methyltransferase